MTNNLFEFAVRGWDKPTYENPITKAAFKIKKEEDILFIAFRYTTESWIDWLWDFFACKTSNIHSGFLASYLSLYLPLRRAIKEQGQFDHIMFVGFSKGGAIAQIAANELPYSTQAIGFATPRWAGKKYLVNYPVNTIRVEMGEDIVPRIPFKWMGYYPVGILLQITPKAFPKFSVHKPSAYREALSIYEENNIC